MDESTRNRQGGIIGMITQDIFISLLESLGFARNKSIYSKVIGVSLLSVDIFKQEIIYPEDQGLTVNERQTCNFSANENFVVFECVYRLLEKGYKPEHIELEPKWKLGRGASGGRADILVKDNFGKPLLIIECKTAGTEFKKAWNKNQQDGDQLFSYAQQISETQFLCLYTSDFENGELTYQSHIIAHRDNDQYLVANPHFKPFRDVTDVKERFTVWCDTYKLDYTTKGIFEGNIQPYQIGKDKYSLDDLDAISASDQQKKYHEFATILRQHNVSGRENAFDKLVNLFLCKLVDEIENPDDLKFYWKGVAYDSHFDLMDRLQQLYQAGMGKFLGEDITYINQNDVNNALRFIKQNPDATQRAVWNLFIQQKFFTNNDFSFVDVHNERLFYQNADVLLKILQMWQDIRLTNPNGHNQFLGDMFEGFLDQGVKQSEGQFFTPMPICRFIMMSLPLESLIRDSAAPPLVIDYACGAGHFLTELALQLQPLLEYEPHASPAEYHKSMIGIEKEYRLSKVAKVSAFMYGQQGTQICYGDGLVNRHEAFPDIRDGHFDLLVANPPYSVRGFLETLPEEERKVDGTLGAIPKELEALAKPARLIDLLDFGRSDFDKTLTLAPSTTTTIKSKWPLKSIATLLQPIVGAKTKVAEKSISSNGSVPVVTQGNDRLVDGYVDNKEPITDLPLIIFGDHTCTFKYVDFPFVRGADGTQLIKCDKNVISLKYLYFYLERIEIHNSGKYERHFKYLKTEQIPIPDEKMQQIIVKECEAIEAEVFTAGSSIKKCQSEMNSEVESSYSSNAPRIEVAKLSDAIQYGLNEKMNEAGVGYKIFRMNEIVQGRMVDNGAMKHIDISAEEFAKYRLNKGDLLFNRTNSIEHVGKTGLFDLDDEYCFASYLVRVAPDTSKVLPLFLVKMMNSPAFQAEAKGKASKSINQSNINATVMKNIKVPVPTLAEQKKFVAKLEALEKRISEAQAIIDAAPARKQAIMQRYL